MAKKKIEEVKENEELKGNVATEATENEKAVEDAKVEENASNEKQDTEVQVTNEVNKLLVVRENFKDKYDEKVFYNPGDVFVEDETLSDNKPIKAEKGKYKVSKERYEELKRSLYVD